MLEFYLHPYERPGPTESGHAPVRKQQTPSPTSVQTRRLKKVLGDPGRARVSQSEESQGPSGDQRTDRQGKVQHLRTPQAAQFLGVSTSFLNHKRLTGGGPPYRKLAAKVVVYDIDDLHEWAKNNSRTSTSGSNDE
jgi:hypothetical protein